VSVACTAEKPAPPKGNPVAGQKLFQEQCAFCHSDTRDEERVGPSLKGLFHREKLPRRGAPVTEENVRRAIEEGASPAGLPPMPAYREILKPNEIDDLVAYLRTL
jgi:mono/diheme cytochrome c family protein